MSRIIGQFSAEGFQTTAFEEDDGHCWMKADLDVDVDGDGSSHGDPYFQPDTTYHLAGKPLNADKHCYGVLPPLLLRAVKGIVLGCLMRITYKDRTITGFVGDVGPTRKVGEASYRWAELLNINPSPISGGVDDAIVLYEWWPGVPGTVDGVAIPLQPYRA